jgi:nucleoside-diphosphate-sugar epimerase
MSKIDRSHRMSKGTVLVTGASGYIAGFAIQQLIAQGWAVRGTIRSLARANELRARLGATADDLALVAADLMRDDGWAEANRGVDYVLHIASPLPAKAPKSDDELVVPAREGALRALRHARDAGVRRLVMTSSTAAICYGMDGTRRVFTEADWTDPAHPDTYPYVRSKVIAERAARDFMAREGGALEFCTINPGAVLGPVLGSDYSASVEIVQKLLSGAVPGSPRIGFPIVDVRDIADAHIRAMTAPGLNGERFLCAGEFLWMSEISQILREELGADARRAPTRQLPDFLVRIVALFDAEIRGVLTEIGKQRICDSRHAETVLGWTARPARETIGDCGRSLVAHGIVKP